jgi:hypothetical protein
MARTVYPRRDEVGLLICETVERDPKGQLLVRGLFPSCEIGAPRALLLEGDEPAAVLEKLCFVFFVEGGVGEFDASLAIHATEGPVAFDERVGRLQADSDGATVFVVRLAPFVLPSYGQHHVVLRLDDREYYATCRFVEAEGDLSDEEIEAFEVGSTGHAASARRVLH